MKLLLWLMTKSCVLVHSPRVDMLHVFLKTSVCDIFVSLIVFGMQLILFPQMVLL